MNTTSNTSDGYSVWNDSMVRELKDTLSEQDRIQLHATLKKLTHSEWMGWLESHGEDVAQFLRANSTERNNQTFDGDNARLLLAYGAMMSAQLAGKMDYWFHDPALSVDWKDKRDTRATRGELLWQAGFESWDPWPFDEPALPSPFDD